jgi:S-adenosylmethionine-diacylgycerolhomoserine-N-methlytransferase
MAPFIFTREFLVSEHAALMDRIYSWQTGIYDLTRKPYLLGRSDLIESLCARRASCFLEIGCGTGRNLIILARRMPFARFYGVDVSVVMLAAAQAALKREGNRADIDLIQADAEKVHPGLFGGIKFEEVFFSYALSMIPDWEAALSRALELVEQEGTLTIVDFGDQSEWPVLLRAFLRFWLKLFHVTPRDDLFSRIHELAACRGFDVMEAQRLYRGYSCLLILRRRKTCTAVTRM